MPKKPQLDDTTPSCINCHARIELNDPAMVILPGAWMWSHEHDVEIFVLDPDAQLGVIQLANGQLALVTDQTTTKHMDNDCFETLVDEEEEESMEEDLYKAYREVVGR